MTDQPKPPRVDEWPEWAKAWCDLGDGRSSFFPMEVGGKSGVKSPTGMTHYNRGAPPTWMRQHYPCVRCCGAGWFGLDSRCRRCNGIGIEPKEEG